jgi:hypothetical protein
MDMHNHNVVLWTAADNHPYVNRSTEQSTPEHMHHIQRLIVVLSTSALFYACSNHTGHLVVVNSAKEPIADVVVLVCRQTIEAHDLQPGRKATGTVRVNCEGDYDVAVLFASGKRLHATTGYVTSGIDFSSEIVVTDVEIKLEATTVR